MPFINIIRCEKCNKPISLKYHEISDGKLLCPNCYAEYKKQLREKK